MTDFRRIAHALPVVLAAALACVPSAAYAEPPEAGIEPAIVAPLLPVAPVPSHLRSGSKRDWDGDGLSNWTEVRRTRTNPRRADTDRDRLSDWVEVRRTRTNPRRRDTDRDGLSDWVEVRRTRTNPRRRDTDRDGVRDRAEILAGSNPRNPLSVPIVAPLPLPVPVPAPSPSSPPSDSEDEDEEDPPPPADKTPPDTSIDSGPPALTNSDEASFGFSGSDPGGSGVAGFQCKLDAAPFADCGASLLLTALEAGNRKLEVRAVDAAGNTDPTPAKHEWTVDLTPPAVSVDSGPDGLTNNASPSFGFSAETGASVVCSLDQGTPDFGPCSSATSHAPESPLADGEHTFRVRATDEASNQATATRSFEVDTALPPAPELTETQPASPANDNEPLLLGAAPAGTTIDLYVGGGCSGAPFATISVAELEAGVEVSVGDDSSTSFRATATTAAENASGCSEALVYVEDSTPPESTIDSGPPALTNSDEASFGFSGSDPGGSGVAGFQCKLDAAAFADCGASLLLTALEAGNRKLEVRAVDGAGNTDPTPAKHEWTVDLTQPVVSVDSGPDGLTNNASPTFGFSAEAGASFVCSIDQGAPDFGPCSDAGSHTPGAPLTDGQYTFRVRATDAAGNQATATTGFELDSTPPETTIDSGPPALTNSDEASFGFSGEDPGGSGVAGFECKLDGASFETCSSTVELTGPSEGSHEFQVRAVDGAGNTDPTPAKHEWEIDLSPPAVSVDSGPDGLTNDASPTFGFSAEAGASVVCSIDQGTPDFGPCSSATSHTPASSLTDGEYTFRVRATDAAGNQATATRSFEVDTALPPAPELTETQPASPANDNEPLLLGAAPAGTTIDLYLGGGCSGAPFATISVAELEAGVEVSVGDDSSTSFRATATTAAENTSGCSEALVYVEDSTPPETSIDSGPPALTNSDEASFAFGSEPGAIFRCKLDEAGFEACSSPVELTGLAEGAHEFQVRATDAAGNADPTPAKHEWTVDLTPPVVSVDSGPDGLTNNASPTFGFSAEAGASVVCSIDSGVADFGPCSDADSHTPESPLADGPHTFRVRATDAAGNQATATRSFEVDTALPPAPELTETQPASPANDNEPLLIGSAPAGTTIDLHAGGSCSGSPLATVGVAELEAGVEVSVGDDSTTSFRATATTAAENVSGCSEALVYVEDSTPPESTIDSGPPALTNSDQASFGFSGSDPSGSGVAGFQCKLDAASFADCGASLLLTALEAGNRKLEVRAVDGAGNADPTPAKHEWTVDLTPPAVSVDSGPDGLTNDASPTFGFSAEAGASVVCSLDQGTPDFGPCSSATSHTPESPLTDGEHTFRIKATDAAGNQATATRSFELDSTPPETTIDSGPPALTNSDEASFGFSGSDPSGSGVAGFECKLDGGSFEACPSGIELTGLSEGSHEFQVRAIDAVGNADPTPAKHEWTVDLTPPAVSVDSGPDGLTNDASPTFGFSAEAGASVVCSIDQGAPDFESCSGAGSHAPESPLADGEHTFRVRATDEAGNQATATRSFEVDTALPPAPELTETQPASPANDNEPLLIGSAPAGTTIDLYAGGSCSGSPLATVSVTELEAGVEVSVGDDSTTSFRATATTAAENTSGCSEALVYVEDSTPPETSIDSGPPALTNSDEASFAFSSEPSATFQCKLDGASFADCGASLLLTALEAGNRKLEVRAVDAAGNADATPAKHEWEIDLTPPAVSVDSGPDGLTNNASPTFGFSAEAGASVVCSIDQGAPDFESCSGATSHTPESPLTDGLHTFRVRATDPAGNQATATRTFTVDTTDPDTQLETNPPLATQSTTADFSFSGSDNSGGSGLALFECSTDDSPWAACTSPQALVDLTEGPHEFEVRAVDKAGNHDPIPASYNWTVDNEPPVVVIEGGPDGLTNDPTPTFGFSSEAGASFECSVDTGAPAFEPCSDPASHTPASPLPQGQHTFRVRATDPAGNQAVATRDFEVDTTAPPAPELISTTPASPANENEPLILGSALADTAVDLYNGGQCNGSSLTTVTPAELEAGIAVPVPDDSTTVFRATVTTPERTSGCSEPLVYVEDSTAPQTTIGPTQPATTYATSASLFFTSNEPGVDFECQLDTEPFGACASPRSFADLSPGPHSFAVRATDAAGNLDQTPAEASWTIEALSSPASACDTGGAVANTAAAVRAAVQAGEDVCVTADVGDVDLDQLGARPVIVSSEGGAMGHIDLSSTTDLTVTQARLRAITLRDSHRVALLGNSIGGTQTERVLDQLIFMPETNNDVRIEGNDIGWTIADDSGNTGYGCRCYGTLNRLRFVGNRVHDIAADGFQGVDGIDVLIDRNEIGPVGRNPGSNEHSDNIQITGNDANLRITNNWIHHQGYYEGEVTANAGSTYIHGGSDGSLIYENNLIEVAQGRTEICGLGTGGSERSNLTVRRNTWVDGGQAFSGFPGFEWDCDSGESNTITRNIAIDPDGGFADHGYDAALAAPNLFGGIALVTFDAEGNCTSANCNPTGEEEIGYRKPSGVSW